MKIKTSLKSLSALILLAGLIPVAFAADEAKPSATVGRFEKPSKLI